MMYPDYLITKDNYKEPSIITLKEPVTIKLMDLRKFLDSIAPQGSFYTYMVDEFTYGEYDNIVKAVIRDYFIDPVSSRYFKEDVGYYKKGQTAFAPVQLFWYYRKNEEFWKTCPRRGYGQSIICDTVEDITITIREVFVISRKDAGTEAVL